MTHKSLIIRSMVQIIPLTHCGFPCFDFLKIHFLFVPKFLILLNILMKTTSSSMVSSFITRFISGQIFLAQWQRGVVGEMCFGVVGGGCVSGTGKGQVGAYINPCQKRYNHTDGYICYGEKNQLLQKQLLIKL